MARATARPVCDALTFAMAAHGVPEQILTDNGKVFTARFGPGPGPVLFDKICIDNGIKHILTAPRSPTTTGKVERWHKTLRREFLDGKVFASIADAQTQLDAWVRHYNLERPHQSIGRVAPIERFQLAEPREKPARPLAEASAASGPVTTRRVSAKGTIGFATVTYKAGVWLAGQTVEVVCEGGLVQIHHRGVLVATHARRHPIDKQTAGVATRPHSRRPSRPSASSPSVTRKVDSSGNVCFAGANYRVGTPIGAARSKSPSSVTPSRSRSVSSSSAATGSSTTAPANTAPSPTPAADPTAPTPPDGFDLSGRYRSQTVRRVPGLDTLNRLIECAERVFVRCMVNVGRGGSSRERITELDRRTMPCTSLTGSTRRRLVGGLGFCGWGRYPIARRSRGGVGGGSW